MTFCVDDFVSGNLEEAGKGEESPRACPWPTRFFLGGGVAALDLASRL